MNQPWVYMCSPSRTPLPLPSPSHPSGLSQSTGLDCPASCIELALVIYFTYGNVHVSVLISHGFDPWVGKTPGEGHSNPLQYSCLENTHRQRISGATAHGVTKCRTHLLFLVHPEAIIIFLNIQLTIFGGSPLP